MITSENIITSDFRNYTSDLRQIFVHVTNGRGSVLLWRRSDMLRRPTYGRLHTIAPAHIATRKGRTLKVTMQVAAPGAESAVYDCFVLASCISKHVSLGTLAG